MVLASFTASDLNLIQMLAARLNDPLHVRQQILNPANRNPDPPLERAIWSDLSLAGGYPGMVLLFAELDQLFPHDHWDTTAHAYIIQIKKHLEKEGVGNASLFGGLAGICFAIHRASRKGTRYQTLLNTLDKHLLEQIQHSYLEPFQKLLEAGNSIPATYYETIQGLAGIGTYLLIRLHQPGVSEILQHILRLFILMVREKHKDGISYPGWHISKESLFLEEERIRYPNGNFNLGLSHGIPGVLVFLSSAFHLSVTERGHTEAIDTIVNWLVRKRIALSHRFVWPSFISWEEELKGSLPENPLSRDAWCYGTPGVARSLYIAGSVLERADLKQFAIDSFSSIFNSPEKAWGIPCPTFCHGLSGLLLITHLMASESSSSLLTQQTLCLREKLLARFDPILPFGFKSLDPQKQRKEFIPLDRVDLLEGASGILLTLLSLHSSTKQWHLPFLLCPPDKEA